MNRLACFVRARLQRRLFAWFGVSIFVTGIAVALVVLASTGTSGTSWQREMSHVKAFAGARFGEVWQDAPARDKLARSISDELDVTVTLKDTSGAMLGVYGRPCRGTHFDAPATRGGAAVGALSICVDRGRPPLGPRFLLPLFVAGVVLWGLSGMISRRLSRPLEELARVAGELGQGNLSARVKVHRHVHGEALVLSAAMNDMAARIQRQVGDQRELLAAVSHELRTPLARIRLLTELTRDGVNVEKCLDDLDREVMEMDALVGDLLASSRLDFTALSKERLDALEVGRRALERAGLGEDKLVVEGDPGEIKADPTLLGRALANLLDNAKKHGGGVVALKIGAEEGRVVFEVEDAGRGLAEGEERRIFEPFYRRPDEKAREQGSLGLGLSLVSRIAEAHGGKARAANRPEGGAKIGFELPRA